MVRKIDMDDVNRFRVFNKLKSVYRLNSVDSRKESSAEHTWSSLVLADFFMSRFSLELDRLKVYELLLYHDVVEIESGDIPLHPDTDVINKNVDKNLLEEQSALILHKQIPFPLNDKFLSLFKEFEEQKTLESRFAKAIDVLDAEIHELDYKSDWKGWSKDFLVKKKLHLFNDFPELKDAFNVVLEFLVENNYFDE